jgi:hypothetical protein
MAKRPPRPTPAPSAEALQRFGPRLDAIGPYEMSAGEDGVEFEWPRPTGLPDLGFRAEVTFVIDTDAGRLDPDEWMFELWDRFVAGLARHAAFFRRELVAAYRADQPYLAEQNEFPPDLPDAEVLRLVRGTFTVKRHEEDGERTTGSTRRSPPGGTGSTLGSLTTTRPPTRSASRRGVSRPGGTGGG